MFMNSMLKSLGNSNIKVTAVGMGCWAIGGFFMNPSGKAVGWGNIDDKESIRAIKQAINLGVNFFETSDVYGAGHSETILGEALLGVRDKVVIGTKFGNVFNEATKQYTHSDVSPQYIRRSCEASLKRLKTDYIDLYQLHVDTLSEEEAQSVADTLEGLKRDGLIRTYGWSTDNAKLAEIFAERPHCASIEYKFNIFRDNPSMIEMCEKHTITSIIRSPLSMGLLSGKFTTESVLPIDDVRGSNNTSGFVNGKPDPDMLAKLAAVREILTSNGRTIVQGALGYIWGRIPSAIPIPGFKTIKQVEENIKAMEFGPLSKAQVLEIIEIINDK